MLNLKKVIALVCVFALALTTVAFGATYTDVAEDSAYYEAVETLNKLNIITGYEDGTFKPEDGVTRAEMAALIARIQGYGETAKAPAKTGFTDVDGDATVAWASGYIANAAGMGIINGYGDGTFGPNDPVLYEQAIKMVMATLGYTPFAEKNGGYPTGYLAAAQRYDVSLAVANAAVGQAANRGTIAQILENAIDTPLMIQSSWNTNGEVVYVIADGTTQGNYTTHYKTLMSENLGYVKIRGIVTANQKTNLYGEQEINTNDPETVTIAVADDYDTENKTFLNRASNKFLVNGTDAADYIGRSVIGYLKVNSKDNLELLSVAVDTNRNNELKINIDQFVGHVAGEANKVEYLKDGANATTKITIDTARWVEGEIEESEEDEEDGYYVGGLSVVYNFNGDVYTDLDAFEDCLYGGTITFIDNNEVLGYDVAIVEVAATAVVDEVEDNYIAFKETAELLDGTSLDGILIDADDEEKIVKVTKDGEEIDIAELNEWDVLSVIAADYDANVLIAEVVTNQVVGTIASTKKSTKSAEIVNEVPTAFKVDDTWYDVAINRAGDTLEIGAGGTFFIDKYGKIAAFQEDSALAGGAAANYGYILGVGVDKAPVFGKPVTQVMLLTSEGNIETMALKNNAKLNGDVIYTTAGTDSTEAADAATALGAEYNDETEEWEYDQTAGVVVRYTKNSKGELSTINTADAADDPNYKFIAKDAEDGDFDADLSKLEGTYIDADAIIFAIDADDAKDSKVVKLADFEDKNEYTVYGVYATNKADDNDIIVVDAEGFTTAGATAGLAVIAGVGETVNDAEEAVLDIAFYVNGEKVEALTTNDVYDDFVDSLTVGDIVKVKLTGDEVSDIAMVYDFDESVRVDGAYDDEVAMEYELNEDEEIDGGVATTYHKNSKLITFESGESYKLADGANKYVINFNVDAEPIVSTQGSYKYFEALYDEDNAEATFKMKKGNTVLDSAATVEEALALTDIVYVREYDGKVTDIVIIKGADSCVKNAD